jgi:hypothetical protein
MKTRTGFVSNSSSSSFILDFGKFITKAEDLYPFITIPNEDQELWRGSDYVEPTIERVAEYMFAEMKLVNKPRLLKLLEQEFDPEQFIETEEEKDRYAWACDARWNARDELLAPLLDKFGLNGEYEITRGPIINLQMFNLAYGPIQLQLNNILKEANEVKAMILDKYIPIALAKIGDSEHIYEAKFEDHDVIGSMLEHDGLLDKFTIMRFSHH